MLEYDRIDVSERIDINKTNSSKECNVCHYWHFKDIGFKYEPYLCNGCNFNDVAIVSVKRSDQRIHFWYMNKDHVKNIMKNSYLDEKLGIL